MMRNEYDRRVEALKRSYGYLFTGPPYSYHLYRGWLTIIEALCAHIDGALTEAERRQVAFTAVTEEGGRVCTALSVAPPCFRVIASGGCSPAVWLAMRQRGGNYPVFERLKPFLREAEATSMVTCILCGAPGTVRRDRRSPLPLCERHASPAHPDFEALFEIMTDCDWGSPPAFAEAIAHLRLGALELRDPSLTRLGVLPPLTSTKPYRLFLEFAGPPRWPERDFEHAVERLIHWPAKSEAFDESAAPKGAVWIIGEGS
jgi:hypothetical protein